MRLATVDILLTIVLVIALVGSAYLGLKATNKKR